MLDQQSGETKTRAYYNYKWDKKECNGNTFEKRGKYTPREDKGGASRYFKIIDRIFYSGKAYKTERNAGCEDFFWKKVGDDFELISEEEYLRRKKKKDNIAKGNPISTLKPINLMRYLIRLVTPKGGTVLDPFAGSGTTIIACIIEGMNYIGIEKRETFANIVIPARIKFWSNPENWETLKDHNLLEKIKVLKNKRLNKGIMDWVK